MKKNLPILKFSNSKLTFILRKLVNSDTIIITDSYNYPTVKDFAQTVVVEDQDISQINKIRESYSYKKVIAVGGCTALDVGRACAVGKEQLIVIPTILSNSCLSTDRSVINQAGVYESEKTTYPKETIISIPTIAENHADVVKNWSAAGFGDLFSRISAAIEQVYMDPKRSFAGMRSEQIVGSAPEIYSALEYVITDYKSFDEDSLKKLAKYLHNASIESINNEEKMLVGSEHKLYYEMQQNEHYFKMRTTHGRLISMGNLISARIFAEATNDFMIYNKFREAHKILGLPLTYQELEKIDVTKEHIINGLKKLIGKGYLFSDYFSRGDYSILDRIFLKN